MHLIPWQCLLRHLFGRIQPLWKVKNHRVKCSLVRMLFSTPPHNVFIWSWLWEGEWNLSTVKTKPTGQFSRSRRPASSLLLCGFFWILTHSISPKRGYSLFPVEQEDPHIIPRPWVYCRSCTNVREQRLPRLLMHRQSSQLVFPQGSVSVQHSKAYEQNWPSP